MYGDFKYDKNNLSEIRNYLPIDENLKDTDPLKCTLLMNNYKYSVEEIILQEFIFV